MHQKSVFLYQFICTYISQNIKVGMDLPHHYITYWVETLCKTSPYSLEMQLQNQVGQNQVLSNWLSSDPPCFLCNCVIVINHYLSDTKKKF